MTEASSREEEGVQVLEPGPVESQQPACKGSQQDGKQINLWEVNFCLQTVSWPSATMSQEKPSDKQTSTFTTCSNCFVMLSTINHAQGFATCSYSEKLEFEPRLMMNLGEEIHIQNKKSFPPPLKIGVQSCSWSDVSGVS